MNNKMLRFKDLKEGTFVKLSTTNENYVTIALVLGYDNSSLGLQKELKMITIYGESISFTEECYWNIVKKAEIITPPEFVAEPMLKYYELFCKLNDSMEATFMDSYLYGVQPSGEVAEALDKIKNCGLIPLNYFLEEVCERLFIQLKEKFSQSKHDNVSLDIFLTENNCLIATAVELIDTDIRYDSYCFISEINGVPAVIASTPEQKESYDEMLTLHYLNPFPLALGNHTESLVVLSENHAMHTLNIVANTIVHVSDFITEKTISEISNIFAGNN